MNWKQPIPTNLDEIFGEDYRCMALYKELIYRACNTDDSQICLGDSNKIVTLNRGQVLYGRYKFSKYLCWDDKTTDRALIQLEKKYKKVTIVRTHGYTLVTLLNYEDIVDMTKWRPSDDLVVTTSKSVKIDKSVKTLPSVKNDIKKHKRFGNPQINKLLSYLKEKLSLTMLDGSDRDNRFYAYHLIRKFGFDVCMKLIEAVAKSQWWKGRITSTRKLFYNAVAIMSEATGRTYGTKRVAINPEEL